MILRLRGDGDLAIKLSSLASSREAFCADVYRFWGIVIGIYSGKRLCLPANP